MPCSVSSEKIVAKTVVSNTTFIIYLSEDNAIFCCQNSSLKLYLAKNIECSVTFALI